MHLPRGYKGINHETIGSDILSLIDSVLMPERIFGTERATSLRATDPSAWYPIATLLDALDFLDTRLGPDSMRRVGGSIFKLSHEAAVRENLSSAYDIIHGLDQMYHSANRGTDIGGWQVREFGAGTAVVSKNTPHHCVMEEGILDAALRVVHTPVQIVQRECLRRGDGQCVFEISSHVIDHRWSGKKKP